MKTKIKDLWVKFYPKIITWRNLGIVVLVFIGLFLWRPVIDYLSKRSSISTTVVDKTSGKVLTQTKISGGTPTISIAGTNVTANVAISYGGPAIAGGTVPYRSLEGTWTNGFLDRENKIRPRPLDIAPELKLPTYIEVRPGDRSFDLGPGQFAIITPGENSIMDIKPESLEINPLRETKNLLVRNPDTNKVHITLTWKN